MLASITDATFSLFAYSDDDAFMGVSQVSYPYPPTPNPNAFMGVSQVRSWLGLG